MKKQTLGMMISSLRKEKGMTQLDLAEEMGVTDKAVSKWERDISCPDINSIPKLADVLGVSVEELMQVKIEANTEQKNNSVEKIINTALKAVGIAQGVAVAVLSVLGEVETNSALFMLGIGLTCVSISLMLDNRTE